MISCTFFPGLTHRHGKRPGNHKDQAAERLFAELFLEYNAGEQNRHDDTQLIDRHYDTDDALLNRVVIAEPGGSRRKPRQCNERKCSAEESLQI